jgi:uncharacterized membrane protein
MKIRRTITVKRPAADLYSFWRDLNNLGRLVPGKARVTAHSDKRSHWTVRVAGGFTFEWDAEIVRDEPDRIISWQSVSGSDVQNSGTVQFKPLAPNVTELEFLVEYVPPAGVFGRLAATLVRGRAEEEVVAALEQAKEMLEANRGE